uniref:UBA domain-containing protein n=1 Tax=Musca domestica TaxID=7370 RepID=A0A1I8NAS8_MUSDO
MTSSTHSSDKHSPHTSPRFSRRSTTPSLMAVQNDLYAGHIPTLSLAAQQQQQQQQQSASANYISAATVLSGGLGGHQPSVPSAPPMSVVNGTVASNSSSATAAGATSSSASASSAIVVASQKSTNRMSAPLMGTNAVIVGGYGNKISNKADISNDNSNSSYAILQNLQESQAIVCKEAQKREANSAALAATASAPSSAPPLPPRKSSPGADNAVTSPTNGPTNGGAIQKATLPQTSKSVDNIAATLGEICVPKTTAPPIPPHNSSHVDTLVEEMRSQRLAGTTPLISTTLSTTATTNMSLLDDDIVGPAETIMGVIDTRPLEASLETKTPNLHHNHHHHQPLLYENISINQKVVGAGDCTVPYENINLEYIARLMNEGYSKENAITALGISRNNIEMACDILREFVAKNSV